MPQPPKKMTYWTYLTIALVTTSAAFALIVLLNNVSLVQNGVDSIVDNCDLTKQETAKDEMLAFFHGNYPCHYLRMWHRFLGDKDDASRCFVRTFLFAAILFSGHYLLASLLLLLVGVAKTKHLAFVPWMVSAAALLLVLVIMVFAEIVIGHDGSFRVGVGAYSLIGLVVYLATTWMVALIACLHIKKDNSQEKHNFDYYKFRN